MSSSELNTNGKNTEPALCSNGCGFFSTEETKGLCSKCYRDFLKSYIQSPLHDSALNIKETLDSNPVDSNKNFSWRESTSSSSDTKSAVTKKNRCGMCNKKVGLTGFQCRCGNMFCGLHRYAEAHDCDFDFKAMGRTELEKANPVIKADKSVRF